MYSLIDADNEENKKTKEANKNVVKNKTHKEYIDILFNKKNNKRLNKKKMKANYIELELLMSPKFHCPVLMIKDTY